MEKINLFHQRFGYGQLKDHFQTCQECDGMEDEECFICDGSKEIFWGSYYYADVGLCEFCKKNDVPIAAMYEDIFGSEWCCLTCYLSHHSEQCGCALWESAESCAVFK